MTMSFIIVANHLYVLEKNKISIWWLFTANWICMNANEVPGLLSFNTHLPSKVLFVNYVVDEF